jgi:hypothetical protein
MVSVVKIWERKFVAFMSSLFVLVGLSLYLIDVFIF